MPAYLRMGSQARGMFDFCNKTKSRGGRKHCRLWNDAPRQDRPGLAAASCTTASTQESCEDPGEPRRTANVVGPFPNMNDADPGLVCLMV